MTIKEFLSRPDIQEYLANEDLVNVYFTYCKERNSTNCAFELTEFFIASGIDPLPYLPQIYPYMYATTDVQSIDIPNNIEEISDNAFYFCDNLKNIYIPDSVKYIGKKAFAHCIDLVRVTIPEDVKEIKPNTFDCCTSMKEITVKGQYTKLPEDTFFTSGNVKIRCYEDSAAHTFVTDLDLYHELI